VVKNSTGLKDSEGDNVFRDILWLERFLGRQDIKSLDHLNEMTDAFERLKNVKNCFQDAVAKSQSRG
jgi:hypothetical protein